MAKVVERFDIFKGLYICKYDNSSNWDIKTRIDKKTRRFATGTPEREKAVALATEKYYEIKTKISLGISPESKGFKAVAEEVIEDLQLNVSNGIKVKTSKIYISAIKMYHIPFFKELPFNAITQKLIKDHNKWKMHIRGEEFFSSTLKNHNAALQKVFDRAIQHGHMAAYQRPELASEGRSQQRRAHFSTQELDILDGAFNKKIERSKSEDEERFWILLYIYTLIRAAFLCKKQNLTRYLSLLEKFSLSELTQLENLCIKSPPLPSSSLSSSSKCVCFFSSGSGSGGSMWAK